MTVDMLAATFFWPEAMVLGSDQSPTEPSESDPDTGIPLNQRDDGASLWGTLKRLFARRGHGEPSALQADIG